jgi:hypothetical protein
MPKADRDEAREERITMEAVVDAYGAEEQAMGWYYYLEGKLQFPFTATCIRKRRSSPLAEETQVEVVGMAPEEECGQEMWVEIGWQDDTLAVPLMQLSPVEADPETEEGVADWHYWVEQGYEFG